MNNSLNILPKQASFDLKCFKCVGRESATLSHALSSWGA